MMDSADDARERLGRLQSYCDQMLRYYTWALKRMPSIPTQRGYTDEVRNLRDALAGVLAYVEGAHDDRAASRVAREEIIPRYERVVGEERWEPDFGERAHQHHVDPSLARPDRDVSVRDAQDEAVDIFAVAQRHLGDARFGGAWIDVSLRRPAIRIAVVDPMESDIDVLTQAGRAGHWDVHVRAVTYSRSTLTRFYEDLHMPPGSAVVAVGWRVELNRVVVTLNRWDPAAVTYFRDRIPADALQIDVVPGLHAVAGDE